MRYLSAGESHGPCLTAIIEGLPAGLEIKKDAIDKHLQRRQGGYGRGGRMKIEKDSIEFLSGLRFNKTIGSPLTLQMKNRDYENWQKVMSPEGDPPPEADALTRPRPGHADLAGGLKYNHDDLRMVLERSSARETAIRVAVGSVGRLLLEKYGVVIYSHVKSIGTAAADIDVSNLPGLLRQVEQSPLNCADPAAEKDMIREIDEAADKGDTLGGVIELLVTGVPPGLGSHVQPDRKLDGRLCGALASIQGMKAVEVGEGLSAAAMPGSLCHDPVVLNEKEGITRPTNRAGGLEGGISNGQPLILRAAMKPIPTLANPLPSIDWITGKEVMGATERSDTCAVPAAAVVAEAVVAWELAVAFREKFAGDFIEEVDAAFQYYMNSVNRRLRRNR